MAKESAKISGYDLSRKWFDFCFENPEKISPNHSALYFFCIEHCNRLGWKEKFGLPTTMAKEAIGIRSYNTYIKTLSDLVDWGFILLVEKSKNQFSSNIIALSNFDKALDKALDKAMIKHTTKQVQSTQQSISSIDKHRTYNIEHRTREIPNSKEFKKFYVRGVVIEKNAGEWLVDKFEPRIDSDFATHFRGLDKEQLLSEFTDSAFLMQYREESHVFNSFRKLCKDKIEENSRQKTPINQKNIKPTAMDYLEINRLANENLSDE